MDAAATENPLVAAKRAERESKAKVDRSRDQLVSAALAGAAGGPSRSYCSRICRMFVGKKPGGWAELELERGVPTTTADSAIFGLQRVGGAKASSAMAKLEAATLALQEKESSLSARAASDRAQAASLYRAGQRKSALQMLQRAKRLDANAEATGAARLACERQTEMLDSVDLQRTVASALTDSSSSIKRAHKGLACSTRSAERGLDTVSEAFDGVEDFQSLLSEFASAGGGVAADEDELLLELGEMVGAEQQAGAAQRRAEAPLEPAPQDEPLDMSRWPAAGVRTAAADAAPLHDGGSAAAAVAP